MAYLEKIYECLNCGEVHSPDPDTGELLPCELCGSTQFTPIIDIEERLKIKYKPANTPGKHHKEIIFADDFHKQSQEWRQLKMTVDRQNNHYEKTVINPNTNEVLYHNSEPLKDHTDRGTAKGKKSNDN